MVQNWSPQPFGNRYYPMLAKVEQPSLSAVVYKKQLSPSSIGTITVIGLIPPCAKCTFFGFLGHRPSRVPEI